VKDWVAWHAAYDDPSSSLRGRGHGHLDQAPRPPDLRPRIREWFRAAGFEEVAFDALDTEALTGVGVGRLAADPQAGLPRGPLFTFLAA
jgi:hypothetical protein